MGRPSRRTPSPPEMITIGTPGLKRSGGFVLEEWHRRLQGIQAVRVYTEMQDNDAVVGACLAAIRSVALSASWDIQPQGETVSAKKAAEFISGCLDDMPTTLPKILPEILTMLTYGWSFFEIVYKWRNGPNGAPSSKYSDGWLGWAGIEYRDQQTLDRWQFTPEGRTEGLWQADYYAMRGGSVYIPLAKALLFRPPGKASNPEGKSILRTAYRSWYYAKRIQEIEAVGIERDLAGLPVMEVPIAIMTDKPTADSMRLRREMESMVQRVRRDEYEGLVIPAEIDTNGKPTGYKFRLATTGGRRSLDVNQVIVRYEMRVALAMLTQFLMIGMDHTGSFALAQTHNDIFRMSVQSYLDSIADVFNESLVGPLCTLNGLPATIWPKMVYKNLQVPTLTELAAYINQLVGAQVLQPDDELEAWTRKVAQMPIKGKKPRDVSGILPTQTGTQQGGRNSDENKKDKGGSS